MMAVWVYCWHWKGAVFWLHTTPSSNTIVIILSSSRKFNTGKLGAGKWGYVERRKILRGMDICLPLIDVTLIPRPRPSSDVLVAPTMTFDELRTKMITVFGRTPPVILLLCRLSRPLPIVR